MASGGVRAIRDVPDILRQHCFLRDAESFQQPDHVLKRGKFLVRHCKPGFNYWILRREPCGRSLLTVYDVRQEHSKGHEIGSVWFPATAEVIDACICRFEAGQPGLVIAVKDVSRHNYPNYLAYAVIGLGTIVKTIGIDYPITCVECLIDSTEISEKMNLISSFESFPHIIAVGTEHGHCYLTHFGLSQPIVDSTADAREPVKPARTIDCSKPYQKKNFGFQPAYNYNNDAVPVMASSDVFVSALCYVNRCFTLFIGYNFGAMLSLNLATQRLEMRQISPGPLISFALQEPEDDPRPQLFLWLACNGRKEARPVLKLFSINFLAEDEESETTYDNAVYNKPIVSPFLEWYPEECSRFISMRTVYMKRSEADMIRKEDGSEASIIGASGGFGSTMTSTLMLVSWIAKRSNSQKFHGALFDLNNLYYRRLARRIEQDKTIARQFHAMAVFSSHECGTKDFILKANEILDVVADVKYGFTRFKNKSSDYADQLMYPSTYNFKCFALTHDSVGDLRVNSIQQQVLSRFASRLMDFVERPLLPAQHLRAIGILSQNAQQFKTKTEMALIFSAMLYYGHFSSVVEVVNNLKESMTQTLSLKDVAEWMWREVELTKKRLDEIANLLRTGTITQLSPEGHRFISHASSVFEGAIAILSALAEKVPENTKVQLNVRVEVVRTLELHVNLIAFFVELGILPERESITHAVDKIRSTIEETKARARAYTAQLNILQLLQRIYDSTENDGFWNSEGFDDWYPPYSVVNIVDIALLNGVTETWKLHIVGYFLLDYGSQVNDSRKVIFKKYGSRFLSAEEREGILAMWYEDQKRNYLENVHVESQVDDPEELMKKTILTEADYATIKDYLLNNVKSSARWNMFVLERRQFSRMDADCLEERAISAERANNLRNVVKALAPIVSNDMIQQKLFAVKGPKKEIMFKPTPSVSSLSSIDDVFAVPTGGSSSRKREYVYELPDEEDLNVTLMSDNGGHDSPVSKRLKYSIGSLSADEGDPVASSTPCKFLPSTPVVNKSLMNTQKSLRDNDWDRVRRVIQTPPTLRRKPPVKNPMRTPTTPERKEVPEIAPPTSILKSSNVSRSRLNRGTFAPTPSRLRFASPERLTREHHIQHSDSTDESSIFSETSFAISKSRRAVDSFVRRLSGSEDDVSEQSFESADGSFSNETIAEADAVKEAVVQKIAESNDEETCGDVECIIEEQQAEEDFVDADSYESAAMEEEQNEADITYDEAEAVKEAVVQKIAVSKDEETRGEVECMEEQQDEQDFVDADSYESAAMEEEQDEADITYVKAEAVKEAVVQKIAESNYEETRGELECIIEEQQDEEDFVDADSYESAPMEEEQNEADITYDEAEAVKEAVVQKIAVSNDAETRGELECIIEEQQDECMEEQQDELDFVDVDSSESTALEESGAPELVTLGEEEEATAAKPKPQKKAQKSVSRGVTPEAVEATVKTAKSRASPVMVTLGEEEEEEAAAAPPEKKTRKSVSRGVTPEVEVTPSRRSARIVSRSASREPENAKSVGTGLVTIGEDEEAAAAAPQRKMRKAPSRGVTPEATVKTATSRASPVLVTLGEEETTAATPKPQKKTRKSVSRGVTPEAEVTPSRRSARIISRSASREPENARNTALATIGEDEEAAAAVPQKKTRKAPSRGVTPEATVKTATSRASPVLVTLGEEEETTAATPKPQKKTRKSVSRGVTPEAEVTPSRRSARIISRSASREPENAKSIGTGLATIGEDEEAAPLTPQRKTRKAPSRGLTPKAELTPTRRSARITRSASREPEELAKSGVPALATIGEEEETAAATPKPKKKATRRGRIEIDEIEGISATDIYPTDLPQPKPKRGPGRPPKPKKVAEESEEK